MNTVNFWGNKEHLFKDITHRKTIQCFTQGQCHSLARAIHKLTGWQLAAMCHSESCGTATADHVVCIHPSGDYVDIHGRWKPGTHFAFLKYVVPVSDDEVRQFKRRYNWDSQNVRNAMPFAREVLRKIAEQPASDNKL